MAESSRAQIEKWVQQGRSLPEISPELRARVLAAATQAARHPSVSPSVLESTASHGVSPWDVPDFKRSRRQRTWNRILAASLLTCCCGIFLLTFRSIPLLRLPMPAVISALQGRDSRSEPRPAAFSGMSEWGLVDDFTHAREQRRKSVYSVLAPRTHQW